VETRPVRALGPDVLGDLVDVVHEPDGVTEGVSIDILNQKRF